MILILILVAAILGFAVFDAIPKHPRPARCRHGITELCGDCVKEFEETTKQAQRQVLERRWDLLRRAEVKRLSQLRLRSANAYAEMQPREFEAAVATLFRELGFEVEQTPFVCDGGKDAIALKGKKKYVIECKRYSSRSVTGRRDLQILLSAQRDVGADGAIFVSTGRLSAPAIAYAAKNRIEYYDESSFPDLVNRAYGGDKAYSTARTICLECGKECSVRLRKKGPATGTHSVVVQGTTQKHIVQTSIDLSQLSYPNLDLDAPWCKDCHIPMKRVSGYRGEFWGCTEFPRCRVRG